MFPNLTMTARKHVDVESGKSPNSPPTAPHPLPLPTPPPHALSPSPPLRRRRRIFGLPVTLVAGASYVASSIAMVLLNKYALSSFDFDCPNSLLLMQCTVAVTLALIAGASGLAHVESMDWRIVKLWYPANVIFVAMIWSSFYALQSMGVAMVTVLKNLTNVLTISGDYILFGRTYPPALWVSLALMIVSAMAGAVTDLEFSAVGYSWQLFNCLVTAAYSLYLRNVMDRVAALTGRKRALSEVSMVLYNNLLSMPLILLLIVYFGEHRSLWLQPDLYNARFQAAVLLSGTVGFSISFASLWFLSTTTPTIYSLVGALNKVPLAVLGLLIFHTATSVQNLLSIAIGLVAGVIFVLAKPMSVVRENGDGMRGVGSGGAGSTVGQGGGGGVTSEPR